MIRSWQLILLRIWGKYRGYLQVTFLIVALTGYCLVLGKYAIDNFEKVTLHNKNASLHRKQAFRYARQMMAPPPPPPPPPPLDLPAVEREMAERRERVAKTCAKYGLGGTGGPNAWEFFVDTRHSLVWCNVFKAASSTWMYNFNLLGGYKEYYLKHSNKTPLVLARAHFPRPTVEKLRSSLANSLSFLIVREPFERLLSAYRNKIESLRHRYYRKVAREMVARHRRPPAPGTAGPPPPAGPTFPEFVGYVTDSAERGRRFDEHWAPFHSFCTPCHVNFTVVAKLETLDRDQEFIVRRAGLGAALRHRLARRRINGARDGATTHSLVSKYYAQLAPEQLDRLYKIYALDFEMFGYNATKYFDLVRGPRGGGSTTSHS